MTCRSGIFAKILLRCSRSVFVVARSQLENEEMCARSLHRINIVIVDVFTNTLAALSSSDPPSPSFCWRNDKTKQSNTVTSHFGVFLNANTHMCVCVRVCLCGSDESYSIFENDKKKRTRSIVTRVCICVANSLFWLSRQNHSEHHSYKCAQAFIHKYNWFLNKVFMLSSSSRQE